MTTKKLPIKMEIRNLSDHTNLVLRYLIYLKYRNKTETRVKHIERK